MSASAKASVKTQESKTGNPPSHANKTNVPASINSAIDQISFLQRTVGNREVERLLKSGVIQAKLTIGQARDAYEHEARRLSEQVMSMPEIQLQRSCACGGRCPRCQAGQSGHTPERLQAKHVGSGGSGQTVVPPIVHEVLRSPGRPLDTATRSVMEQRFGHDFSRVRVHTEAQAAESARAVDALAYTVGRDVVFSEGRYTPHLRQGSKLLAHELAHVIQQERGGASPPALRGGMLEQAADAAASAFAAGRGPVHVGGASGPKLARQPLLAGPDPNVVREPRSLRESLWLDPELTKDWQLEEEIELIKEWLDANPFDPRRDHLRKELRRLQAGKSERRKAEEKRQQAKKSVQIVVKELNGRSSEKVLMALFFEQVKLDPLELDLLKQWALELKEIHHRKSGNYLLLFFEKIRDFNPTVADDFVKVLAKKGVMVEEISLAWELHKLVVEEQSKHLRPQLEKYPVYNWKVKLGAVAKPIVDFVERVIHFVPVLGQAVGALEAIAGQEILTGEKLEGWERLLGILPYAGTIWKAGKEGARAILVIARQTGLSPDAALRLIKNTSALSSDAERLREIKKIVDLGRQPSAEQLRTLKAAHGALKPLEGEAGIASTATQRPSPAAGAIKQETKAIESTAPPTRAATPVTAVPGATTPRPVSAAPLDLTNVPSESDKVLRKAKVFKSSQLDDLGPQELRDEIEEVLAHPELIKREGARVHRPLGKHDWEQRGGGVWCRLTKETCVTIRRTQPGMSSEDIRGVAMESPQGQAVKERWLAESREVESFPRKKLDDPVPQAAGAKGERLKLTRDEKKGADEILDAFDDYARGDQKAIDRLTSHRRKKLTREPYIGWEEIDLLTGSPGYANRMRIVFRIVRKPSVKPLAIGGEIEVRLLQMH